MKQIGSLELLEHRFDQALKDPLQVRIARTIMEQIEYLDHTALKRWGFEWFEVLPKANITKNGVPFFTCMGGCGFSISDEANKTFGEYLIKVVLLPSKLLRVSIMKSEVREDGVRLYVEKEIAQDLHWGKLVERINALIYRNAWK